MFQKIEVLKKGFTIIEILLSGAQMDQMSDNALAQIVDRVVAYYRATPLHKLRIVKALQVSFIYTLAGGALNY